MPKQVILDWDEYMTLYKCADACCKIFDSASAAIQLNMNGLITEENAKAYLMPILKILEETLDAN